MKKGFVSGVAMNGAALIHDFEIALVGNTSEDVEAGIGAGQFGMAEETGRTINEIAKLAQRLRMGYGEAAGQYLSSGILSPKHRGESVLMEAYRLRIPVTVHLAIGTDIPHMHPAAEGAALGAASLNDFRLFCALVQQMDAGGVYLNWGSAVLLPEVFLKAVSVVRNLGVALHPITTANFDFIQHYRPLQNVVKRPTAASKESGGKESRGFAITGHHELLFPLVAAALAEGWPKSDEAQESLRLFDDYPPVPPESTTDSRESSSETPASGAVAADLGRAGGCRRASCHNTNSLLRLALSSGFTD